MGRQGGRQKTDDPLQTQYAPPLPVSATNSRHGSRSKRGPGALSAFRREKVQVESQAIDEITYDAAASIMFVRFAHGGWYTYFDVPGAVYEAFVAAESHGRFFHEHIRDRYKFRRGR